MTSSTTLPHELLHLDLSPQSLNDPVKLIEIARDQLFIDGNRAGQLGRYVLDLTREQPAMALRGEAWFQAGLWMLRSGNTAAAVEANQNARTSFTANCDPRGVLLCDEFEAIRLRSEGRLSEAMELHLRISSRSDVARYPIDVYLSHNARALTRRQMGDYDQMLLDLYEALEVAQSCGSPGPRINAYVNLGTVHCDLYNLSEARRISEEALNLAEEAGAWEQYSRAVFTLGQVYDGLGLAQECAELLKRVRATQPKMPLELMAKNTPQMVIANLCAGDLDGARAWLDRGASAMFADGDGKTDFARARACYLVAVGKIAEGRKVAEDRITECERLQFQDHPYSRMRLLQAATDACERLADPSAALVYLHEAHRLYEALVSRSSRAGFIAVQAAHDYATARRDRDIARIAHEKSELDRCRLEALNTALEERVDEAHRLNAALQRKIAEAQALQELLHDQAIRDPLTGLYNRRFLIAASFARIELALRLNNPLAIVLIDIDRFKQVNDGYGHACGDDVLRQFAELLRDRLRASDVICRFGGEEFLLLVDNCEQDALIQILNSVMHQFRSKSFRSGKMFVGDLTFSAGIAVLGVDGDDFEALARVADERMYQAKATGRARICTSNGADQAMPSNASSSEENPE